MNNSPKRISSELISEKIKIIKDIDLNTLFNLNYNFDPLKGLIEHLLTNQEKLQNQIDEMCSKAGSISSGTACLNRLAVAL